MNIFKSLLILAIFLLNIFSVVKVLAQESQVSASPSAAVSSYELFWPITAGRTMGDSLYWVKELKESLRGLFIFGDLKKAGYNIELSDKRIVEAEKLFIDIKDYSNGKKTLEEAKLKREQALKLLNDAHNNKKPVESTVEHLKSSLESQKVLLESVKSKVPQEQQENINQGIEAINAHISSVQDSF